jgi:hypothetical protein
MIGSPVLEKFTINFRLIDQEDDEASKRIMILTLLSTLTSLSPIEPLKPWQVLFETETPMETLVQVPDEAVEGRLKAIKSVDIGSHRVEILVQESVYKPVIDYVLVAFVNFYLKPARYHNEIIK